MKIKGMSIQIERFTFNAFQENTIVVHDGTTCVIIDPGCYNIHEQNELTDFIDANGLRPAAVLLTHAHIDHVLGCAYITQHYGIGYYIHEADIPTLNAVSGYAHVYGFPGYTPPQDPSVILHGGENLEFGEMHFEVLFTPGHAPGHVVYYLPEQSCVINGDVLFAGSFGRVDLPGGDLGTLKNSIFTTMFALPDETVVYCGHGSETTIGMEKQRSYILQF